jgi:hypothetical protein
MPYKDMPMDANGQAYSIPMRRYGVPLEYVGDKLARAIEGLHRHAGTQPERQQELLGPMYYLLVSYLGLHNMLAKANDRTLPERLLAASAEELNTWLVAIERDGDVAGLNGLDQH